MNEERKKGTERKEERTEDEGSEDVGRKKDEGRKDGRTERR